MSTNLDDERAIDALCRLWRGWSPKCEGDEQDYDAARKLVDERAIRVRGTFREPTELERYRSALESIAKNTCCDKCQQAARVARAALK